MPLSADLPWRAHPPFSRVPSCGPGHSQMREPKGLTLSEEVVTFEDAARKGLREALDQVYSQVPGTRCGCDKPGQCCELTEEEMRADYVTMYPLYAAEYLNITHYLRYHMPREEGETLLGHAEERPARCPFLEEGGTCRIHPVRPMTCRTYGVLRRENLLAAGRRHGGLIPITWIDGFISMESTTVCPHTEILDPDRIVPHEDSMICGAYDQALSELSRSSGLLDERRRGLLVAATGLTGIFRWTWGGFNVLVRSPEAWFREHFAGYLRGSSLSG